MLAKRIIPCLDIKEGRTVKGIKFQHLQDLGDPVELAIHYDKSGADELVFLDISATTEKRKTLKELVKNIARNISIPFTVGGGINCLEDAYELLSAGADKISINSAAVQSPELINKISGQFGSQFIVLAIDTKKVNSISKVHINGGNLVTSRETNEWVKEAESRGAGEILLTSIDYDGMRKGFDLALLQEINQSISIPLIASGGAGNTEHFIEVFRETEADGALAAGIFHQNILKIQELKKSLDKSGITIRK